MGWTCRISCLTNLDGNRKLLFVFGKPVVSVETEVDPFVGPDDHLFLRIPLFVEVNVVHRFVLNVLVELNVVFPAVRRNRHCLIRLRSVVLLLFRSVSGHIEPDREVGGT